MLVMGQNNKESEQEDRSKRIRVTARNNTIRSLRIERAKMNTHTHRSHNHAQMTLFGCYRSLPHPPQYKDAF